MSIVSIREIPDGRSGSAQGNLAVDSDRCFRIITNSNYDDANKLLFDPLLPNHGSTNPNNPWSTLRKWDFRQAVQGSGRIWLATAKYSSQPESRQEREKREQPNPLLRRARVSISFEKREVGLVRDRDGHPFVTSAGEPYANPPTRYESVPVIELTKNLPAYPPWFFTHNDKLNSGTVVIYTAVGPMTFAARTLKFNPVGIVDVEQEGSFPYVEARYRFEYSADEHKVRLLDYGRWYLNDSDELIKGAVDEELLDSTGHRDPDAEAYNVFNIFPEASFAGIPIS